MQTILFVFEIAYFVVAPIVIANHAWHMIHKLLH